MGNAIANVTRQSYDLGGGVRGGIAAPAPAYNWDYELLETGLTGLSWIDDSGNNAVDWLTDGSGSHARITYNQSYTSGLRLNLPDGYNQSLVQFKIRRHSTACSKMLKTVSTATPSTANYTIGTSIGGYTGTALATQYDEDGGDTKNGFFTTGVAGGGSPALTRTPFPTEVINSAEKYNFPTDGSTWVTVEVFAKFNTSGVNDGEFAIQIDGVTKFHWADVFNCREPCGPTDRDRKYIGLAEYSGNSGFYEDYKELKVGYDRPDWLA